MVGDEPGKRSRPCEDGAGVWRPRPGGADRLRLGRGRAAGGGEAAVRSLPFAAACAGATAASAAGSASSKRLESVRRDILVAHVRVADRRDMVEQAALEAGAVLGRGERLGSLRGATAGRPAARAASSSASNAARPPARTRSSGSWPGGMVTKPRSGRARHGAARAAPRGPPPSVPPHRRRSRAGAGTSRHSRSSCASVSAVPSGATASPMPAWSSAITSIWPSTTITPLGCAAGGRRPCRG